MQGPSGLVLHPPRPLQQQGGRRRPSTSPCQLHPHHRGEGRGKAKSVQWHHSPGMWLLLSSSAQCVRVERQLSLGTHRCQCSGGGSLPRSWGSPQTPPPLVSTLRSRPCLALISQDGGPGMMLEPHDKDRMDSGDTEMLGLPLTLSSSKLMRPSSSVSRSSCSSTTRARSSVGAARGRSRLSTRSQGDCRAQLGLVSCCSRLSLCFLAKFTNTWKEQG